MEIIHLYLSCIWLDLQDLRPNPKACKVDTRWRRKSHSLGARIEFWSTLARMLANHYLHLFQMVPERATTPISVSIVRYDGSPENLRAARNIATTLSHSSSASSDPWSMRIFALIDMSSGGWNSMYVIFRPVHSPSLVKQVAAELILSFKNMMPWERHGPMTAHSSASVLL